MDGHEDTDGPYFSGGPRADGGRMGPLPDGNWYVVAAVPQRFPGWLIEAGDGLLGIPAGISAAVVYAAADRPPYEARIYNFQRKRQLRKNFVFAETYSTMAEARVRALEMHDLLKSGVIPERAADARPT